MRKESDTRVLSPHMHPEKRPWVDTRHRKKAKETSIMLKLLALDVGLLACRTVRKEISVIQGSQSVIFCYGSLSRGIQSWKSQTREEQKEFGHCPSKGGLGFFLPTPEGHVASICESQQNGTALGSSHTDILCFILFWGPENKTYSYH